MHKDIAFIMKIPFESKKTFNPKSNSKYYFQGDAYYLINKDGKILRDFMLIDKTKKLSYRHNDNAMRIGDSGKGTDFYKKQGADRESIFDYASKDRKVSLASKKMVKKLNSWLLKNTTTVLSGEAMITGSTSTGAKTSIDATPIISTDEHFYGMRFVNALKSQRDGKTNTVKKYTVTKKEIRDKKCISLKLYLKKFEVAKEEFYRFNPEAYDLIFNGEMNPTKKLYFSKFNKDKLEKEVKNYNDMVLALLAKYKKNDIKKDNLVKRLKGIFRPLLIIEHQQKKEDTVVGRNEKDSNMDAAHILEVKLITKMEDKHLWKIADVNNGLLLTKDLHWKFDKDKDFFLNNDFSFIENGIPTNERINKTYINKNRKKYIVDRNKKMGYK